MHSGVQWDVDVVLNSASIGLTSLLYPGIKGLAQTNAPNSCYSSFIVVGMVGDSCFSRNFVLNR